MTVLQAASIHFISLTFGLCQFRVRQSIYRSHFQLFFQSKFMVLGCFPTAQDSLRSSTCQICHLISSVHRTPTSSGKSNPEAGRQFPAVTNAETVPPAARQLLPTTCSLTRLCGLSNWGLENSFCTLKLSGCACPVPHAPCAARMTLM